MLEPLLFIYISDIAKIISNTQIKLEMYAENCIICKIISSTQDQGSLITAFFFLAFHNGSETWKLSSCKNSVDTTFSNKKWPLHFKSTNYGVSLVHVTELEYIGVTPSTNLKWQSILEQYKIFENFGISDTR